MKKGSSKQEPDRKHTKKGVGRGCYKPAGSKSSLKGMGWAMMRVFFPKEVVQTPGTNKVGPDMY